MKLNKTVLLCWYSDVWKSNSSKKLIYIGSDNLESCADTLLAEGKITTSEYNSFLKDGEVKVDNGESWLFTETVKIGEILDGF